MRLAGRCPFSLDDFGVFAQGGDVSRQHREGARFASATASNRDKSVHTFVGFAGSAGQLIKVCISGAVSFSPIDAIKRTRHLSQLFPSKTFPSNCGSFNAFLTVIRGCKILIHSWRDIAHATFKPQCREQATQSFCCFAKQLEIDALSHHCVAFHFLAPHCEQR